MENQAAIPMTDEQKFFFDLKGVDPAPRGAYCSRSRSG